MYMYCLDIDDYDDSHHLNHSHCNKIVSVLLSYTFVQEISAVKLWQMRYRSMLSNVGVDRVV